MRKTTAGVVAWRVTPGASGLVKFMATHVVGDFILRSASENTSFEAFVWTLGPGYFALLVAGVFLCPFAVILQKFFDLS